MKFPVIGIMAAALFQSLELFAAAAAIEFPGTQPGAARASEAGGVFTLENDVLAASWRLEGGTLRPFALADKISRTGGDQNGAELFRLATSVASNQTRGFVLALHLDADRIVALASRDGEAWTEVASFPRADFRGEPRFVRIGKMNLKAQAKDNYDPGADGECSISEITPRPAALPSGKILINTGAHRASITEFAFRPGCRSVSCRIDKGTDQGMSWAPAIALVWEDGARFLLFGLREEKPVFNVTTASGEQMLGKSLSSYSTYNLPASSFKLLSPPRIVELQSDPRGVRVADRIGGKAIAAEFASESGLCANWRAELRDDSNYIRTTLDLLSAGKTIPIRGVELIDARVENAKTIGRVPGCPVAAGNFFLGVEMPGAQNAVGASGAKVGVGCQLEVSPSQSYAFGAVAGVAAAGQLRRSFLYYIERERARPSKPFLHYNCWYDLGYGLDETKLLDVVKQFDAELVKKRGVPVLSYLADDGWDTPGRGLWAENTNKFPHGFAGLNEKMKQMDAHLSVWISPLGGYGGAKERTETARKMGLIPEGGGLDLAQPKYKAWFQNRCLDLMRNSGVNAFKWDKAGEGVSPHFMALLDIARNLRKENPDLFINVTVGTWPSPFWLNHIDSTWRNGSGDMGWSGKGRDASNKYDREKWLTFRDAYCRQLFVEASPLYPLNSTMLHGIVHGRHFQGGDLARSNPPDLKNESRSYFANGSSLQELYLTPSLLNSDSWDQVAEAAKWAHENADVLVDAHWVGGDPLKFEAYGFAAWNRRKGTLMLRNPDDKPQTISLDAATVFDLPADAPRKFRLTPAYGDQHAIPLTTLRAGLEQQVTLQPFDVLVFDAEPVQ